MNRLKSTVLVTRAKHQSDSLAQLLTQVGATVYFQPAIEIVPTEAWHDLQQALQNDFAAYSRLVFVSTNSVKFFFERLEQVKPTIDLNAIGIEIATIGNSTHDAVVARGCNVDLVPPQSNSHALADLLIAHPTPGKTMVLRADRGSPELGNRLTAASVAHRSFAVYLSRDVKQASPEIVASIQAGEIDWVTVTSSAIAKSIVNLIGDALHKTKIVSISPATSDTLIGLGFSPTAEATEYNMAGLVDALTND